MTWWPSPTPGGATILGKAVWAATRIATLGEKQSGTGWRRVRRAQLRAFRSYYQYPPKGQRPREYTVP